MSSTPIYDELAATYLADLTPDAGTPAAPAGHDPSARQPGSATARGETGTAPGTRPKV